MIALHYDTIVNLNSTALCQDLESHVAVKLGNIGNDNPTYTNGYMNYGDDDGNDDEADIFVYLYEDADIAALGNGFFQKVADIDNIVIDINNYFASVNFSNFMI